MGARTKLNFAVVNGALLFAAIVGGVLQSWTAFVVMAAMLIVGGLYAGDIRPKGDHPTHRRG